MALIFPRPPHEGPPFGSSGTIGGGLPVTEEYIVDGDLFPNFPMMVTSGPILVRSISAWAVRYGYERGGKLYRKRVITSTIDVTWEGEGDPPTPSSYSGTQVSTEEWERGYTIETSKGTGTGEDDFDFDEDPPLTPPSISWDGFTETSTATSVTLTRNPVSFSDWSGSWTTKTEWVDEVDSITDVLGEMMGFVAGHEWAEDDFTAGGTLASEVSIDGDSASVSEAYYALSTISGGRRPVAWGETLESSFGEEDPVFRSAEFGTVADLESSWSFPAWRAEKKVLRTDWQHISAWEKGGGSPGSVWVSPKPLFGHRPGNRSFVLLGQGVWVQEWVGTFDKG